MLKLNLQYFAGNDDTSYIYVWSNGGSPELFYAYSTSNITVTITESGFTLSGGTIYEDGSTYTYEGNKTLLGFATSANATEPTYTTGDTLTISADGTTVSLYIVEAEATTSGVTIKYNGSTIASLESGQTATLACSGKKMKSDIVVTAPEAEGGTDSPLPIEVSTEAEMTALLESGEVGGVYKYTGTTGTYEKGALYVLEGELITFTIDGTSYQAEEGMTWGEWAESDYDTLGVLAGTYIIRGGSYICTSNSASTSARVLATDTITQSAVYYLVSFEPS